MYMLPYELGASWWVSIVEFAIKVLYFTSDRDSPVRYDDNPSNMRSLSFRIILVTVGKNIPA
jgi:hypothetical protein